MVWDGEGGSKSHRGRPNMMGLGVWDAPWWILPTLQTRKKVWPLIEHSTAVFTFASGITSVANGRIISVLTVVKHRIFTSDQFGLENTVLKRYSIVLKRQRVPTLCSITRHGILFCLNLEEIFVSVTQIMLPKACFRYSPFWEASWTVIDFVSLIQNSPRHLGEWNLQLSYYIDLWHLLLASERRCSVYFCFWNHDCCQRQDYQCFDGCRT